jgi:hypothetical protein
MGQKLDRSAHVPLIIPNIFGTSLGDEEHDAFMNDDDCGYSEEGAVFEQPIKGLEDAFEQKATILADCDASKPELVTIDDPPTLDDDDDYGYCEDELEYEQSTGSLEDVSEMGASNLAECDASEPEPVIIDVPLTLDDDDHSGYYEEEGLEYDQPIGGLDASELEPVVIDVPLTLDDDDDYGYFEEGPEYEQPIGGLDASEPEPVIIDDRLTLDDDDDYGYYEEEGLEYEQPIGGLEDLLETGANTLASVTSTSSFTSLSMRRSSLKQNYDIKDIPVCTDKKSWKNLPAPCMKTVEKSAMKRVESMGSFFSHDLQSLGNNAATTMKAKTMKKSTSKVNFAEVTIRDYGQTLGDNPCVGYGPPISLDWNYSENEPVDLDAYEDGRGDRRTLRQMGLNYYKRKHLLNQYGHTDEEMKQAKKEVEKVKAQRAVTKHLLKFQKVEDILTSATRKAKRVVSGGKKDPFNLPTGSSEFEEVKPSKLGGFMRRSVSVGVLSQSMP